MKTLYGHQLNYKTSNFISLRSMPFSLLGLQTNGFNWVNLVSHLKTFLAVTTVRTEMFSIFVFIAQT